MYKLLFLFNINPVVRAKWCASILLPLLLISCIPNNKGANTKANSLSSILGSLTNSSTPPLDGAQGQCALIDPTSPNRLICVNCFNSVLQSRCPNQTTPLNCVDQTVVATFPDLVNQCISQTVLAGFTCNTICPATQVLDAASCSCVDAPPPVVNGSGGADLIDVGQTDFGPPVVSASWPQVPPLGSDLGVRGNVCTGILGGGGLGSSDPLRLLVRNRGDTVFWLNQYGQPSASRSSCADNLTTPSASTFFLPSANVIAGFKYKADAPIAGAPTRSGLITHFSGNGVPILTGEGGAAVSAGWQSPGRGTSDSVGNVFFSDPNLGIIRVICEEDAVSPNNPHCGGLPRGSIHTVPISVTTPLSSPQGIAVDFSGNIYVADSGHSVISVCNVAGGFVCGAIAGTPGMPGNCDAVALQGAGNCALPDSLRAGYLNNPTGIDIEQNPGRTASNLYIADTGNNSIRAICNFDPGSGPCACARDPNTHLCTGLDPMFDGMLATIITVGPNNAGFAGDGLPPNPGVDIATKIPFIKLNNPTDVKINQFGNLFIADNLNNRIRAVCYDDTKADACNGQAALSSVPPIKKLVTVRTVAGLGSALSSKFVPIARPLALAVDKTPPIPLNNDVAFTEQFFSGIPGDPQVTGIKVDGLVGIPTSIGLGDKHSCAVLTDGTVKCFGANSTGQLGNNTTTSNGIPQNVLSGGGNLSGIASVSGGGGHTCAVVAPPGSGGAFCWGANNNGQLGISTATNPNTNSIASIDLSAVRVTTLSQTVQISAGENHTCAATLNGVWCWGANSLSQVGIADGKDKFKPVHPTGLGATKVAVKVAAGAAHSCAIIGTPTAGGTNQVWCWGDNSAGQTGLTDDPSVVPIEKKPKPILTDTQSVTWPKPGYAVWDIAAGSNHNCAIVSNKDPTISGADSSLWCWGDGSHGQLGLNPADPIQIGDPTGFLNAPREVAVFDTNFSGIHFVQLTAGSGHTCGLVANGGAISTGGHVRCWGSNSAGQLGDGTTQDHFTPNEVLGVSDAIQVAAGADHTCLVRANGQGLLCFGANDSNQLSSGSFSVPNVGNTVKVLCGPPSAAATPKTFCQGLPNTYIITVAGQEGIIGTSGDNGPAINATFASLQGITYDKFNNLIVGSTARGTVSEYALRNIGLAISSQTCGIKYSFTDSNSLTSNYCLRFSVQTQCGVNYSTPNPIFGLAPVPAQACDCTASPTLDLFPSFFRAQQANDECGL